MIKNPLKTLALAAGTLAFAASANAAFVTYDWGADDLQGWTVINGLANFDGDGIQAGDVPNDPPTTNNNAHDAAHPNFVVQAPNFINLPAVDPGVPLVEIDWHGGSQGGNNAPTIPLSQSEAVGWNGGTANDAGAKSLAFVAPDGTYLSQMGKTANGGDETQTWDYATLIADGLTPGVNYRLQYYDTDQGGWGWSRPRDVRVDDSVLGAAVPEPSSVGLLGLGAFALLFFRRRRK